jgi:hypothetical protein
MKRFIAVLSVAVLALVFWNRFSNSEPAIEENSARVMPKSNAVDRPAFRSATGQNTPRDPRPVDAEDYKWDRISVEQVEAYLLRVHRSAEGLLNAFEETGDTNYLAEAALKFPDNPLVQMEMLFQETSIEEHQQWLERFKKSSPDNALPNYFSALEKFKSGSVEAALGEMDSASKKTVNSFDQDRIQSREEMYLLTGYFPVEAAEAAFSYKIATLPKMREMSRAIDESTQKYRAAGDYDSVRELAAVGVEAGRQFTDGKAGPSLSSRGWGAAMEEIALKNLDADTYYDFLGSTAGQRVQELKIQKKEWRDLGENHATLYFALSDSEKLVYYDRFKLYGELTAMRWLKRNYGREAK